MHGTAEGKRSLVGGVNVLSLSFFFSVLRADYRTLYMLASGLPLCYIPLNSFLN